MKKYPLKKEMIEFLRERYPNINEYKWWFLRKEKLYKIYQKEKKKLRREKAKKQSTDFVEEINEELIRELIEKQRSLIV